SREPAFRVRPTSALRLRPAFEFLRVAPARFPGPGRARVRPSAIARSSDLSGSHVCGELWPPRLESAVDQAQNTFAPLQRPWRSRPAVVRRSVAAEVQVRV